MRNIKKSTIDIVKDSNRKLINGIVPEKSYASSLDSNQINDFLKKAFYRSNSNIN